MSVIEIKYFNSSVVIIFDQLAQKKCSHHLDCTHKEGRCDDGLCRCVGMYAGNGIFCSSKKQSIYGNGRTRRVSKKLAVSFRCHPVAS